MTNIVEFAFESPKTQSNLRSLNLSTLKGINIELSQSLNVDSDDGSQGVDMAIRDEIIARLRQLPEVLGLSDGEIAATLGISPSLWSNYKAENTDVTIRPLVALELWKAFGIPMEWVYGGESALAEPSLRAKLAMANRRAEVWLASRRPIDNLKSRILAALAIGAALVAFPPEAGRAWNRTSGLPISVTTYNRDRLICRGEAAESHLPPEAVMEWGAIYIGCMSEHGYVPNGEWFKP